MLHDLVDNLEAGQILKLPQLAATLDLLATEGPDGLFSIFQLNLAMKLKTKIF